MLMLAMFFKHYLAQQLGTGPVTPLSIDVNNVLYTKQQKLGTGPVTPSFIDGETFNA